MIRLFKMICCIGTAELNSCYPAQSHKTTPFCTAHKKIPTLKTRRSRVADPVFVEDVVAQILLRVRALDAQETFTPPPP